MRRGRSRGRAHGGTDREHAQGTTRAARSAAGSGCARVRSPGILVDVLDVSVSEAGLGEAPFGQRRSPEPVRRASLGRWYANS